MEGLITRGWHYPPRVRRDLEVGPRGNSRSTPALRAPANRRSIHRGGVSTPRGTVSTREIIVSVSGLELYRLCMEIFMNRGWGFILPRCGGASTLAQGATFAARWLYGPHPINNQWMGRYSFVCSRLGHLTIDHASLSRRSTVPAPN